MIESSIETLSCSKKFGKVIADMYNTRPHVKNVRRDPRYGRYSNVHNVRRLIIVIIIRLLFMCSILLFFLWAPVSLHVSSLFWTENFSSVEGFSVPKLQIFFKKSHEISTIRKKFMIFLNLHLAFCKKTPKVLLRYIQAAALLDLTFKIAVDSMYFCFFLLSGTEFN